MPYGTDPRLVAFQPRKLSGLVTIISPFLLRRPELRRTSRDNKPAVHIFEATSPTTAPFEDEDDDENEVPRTVNGEPVNCGPD